MRVSDRHPDAAPAGGSEPGCCVVCGRAAPEGALDWSLQVRDGRTAPICPTCTRDHVRDIEADLDVHLW